ncbi:MAG: hypothetical protein LBR83_05715, partial [Clostridiales bacterium]|nr:hypothetical protein [Clostridiales bacterium]
MKLNKYIKRMKRGVAAIVATVMVMVVAPSANVMAREADGLTETPTALSVTEAELPDISTGLLVKSNGELWMWGENEYGRLGDGTTEDRLSPVRVMNNVAHAVTDGKSTTMAITKDGELWGWGANDRGRVGDGTAADRHSPVFIMADVAYVNVDSPNSVFAITKDKTLWRWGRPLNGGNNILKPTPVMENVEQIKVMALTQAMIITADSKLYALGANSPRGRLGNGTTQSCPTPEFIMDNVASVTGDGSTTMAVTNDGKLYGWGWNGQGQLGDGTTTNRFSPVFIMDNVAKVPYEYDPNIMNTRGSGLSTVMAIKTNGELWGWGWNFTGSTMGRATFSGDMQLVPRMNSDGSFAGMVDMVGGEVLSDVEISQSFLGDGTLEENRLTPVHIMDNVVDVIVTNDRSLALTTDGRLWEWGYLSVSQLDDGTVIDNLKPRLVLENVASYSAENFWVLALTKDGRLFGWGDGRGGVLGIANLDAVMLSQTVPSPVHIANDVVQI